MKDRSIINSANNFTQKMRAIKVQRGKRCLENTVRLKRKKTTTQQYAFSTQGSLYKATVT